MELEALIQLVSNAGIVGAMLIYQTYTNNKIYSALLEANNSLSKSATEAINNNTVALTTLSAKFDALERRVDFKEEQ